MVLARFPVSKLTETLDFVSKNAGYLLEQTPVGHQLQLRVTGAHYSQKLASAVETHLNLRSVWCCCSLAVLSMCLIVSVILVIMYCRYVTVTHFVVSFPRQLCC